MMMRVGKVLTDHFTDDKAEPGLLILSLASDHRLRYSGVNWYPGGCGVPLRRGLQSDRLQPHRQARWEPCRVGLLGWGQTGDYRCSELSRQEMKPQAWHISQGEGEGA